MERERKSHFLVSNEEFQLGHLERRDGSEDEQTLVWTIKQIYLPYSRVLVKMKTICVTSWIQKWPRAWSTLQQAAWVAWAEGNLKVWTEKAQNKKQSRSSSPHIVFTSRKCVYDRVLGSSILFITITLVIWMKLKKCQVYSRRFGFKAS